MRKYLFSQLVKLENISLVSLTAAQVAQRATHAGVLLMSEVYSSFISCDFFH